MLQITENSFAEACLNQNSIAELQAALSESADQSDMSEWGLTGAQWREQIQIALDAKLAGRG